MNYSKIYDSLVRKKYADSEYMESHHILPKCMGGKNFKENMIKVPYRVHFLCHWLLCKMHPDNFKLKAAFTQMLRSTKNHQRIVSSKQFDIVKRTIKNTHFPWLIEANKNGPWNKGKTGVQVPWNKGKNTGPHSEESNAKRSEKLKERFSKTAHHLKSQSPWNKGKTGVQVPWNRGKISQKFECVNCKKMFDAMNLKKWHGDNCKHVTAT